MANKVRKPHHTASVIREFREKQTSVKDLEENECFVLSLKHLDRKQGPTLQDWEQDNMLALAMETLAGYCHRPLNQQFNDSFSVYGDFPLKTEYTHPAHVPPDAKWARIHVNGVHVLAGHIFKNVFYLVFLDNKHAFYKTEKKNT